MRSKQGSVRTALGILAVLAVVACLAALPVRAEEAAPPADPTPADTGPGPGTAAPPEVGAAPREAAQARFLSLLEQGRNEEAVAAARDVVELTRQESGEDSTELAAPLTNLATALYRAGDLAGAESNYRSAIDLLERRYGVVSARLINPLTGLGDVYVRGEQYAQATDAYGRALHVNHVNEGFYNLEQFRLRDGLTEGYLGLGDLDKANLNQERQVAIQRRRLGRGNPELTPALLKLGRWYERTNQAESARFVYQETARVIEETEGPASADLVDPLIALAGSYRLQALLPPDPDATQGPQTLLPMSSAMLRRALVIVDQQQPPDLRKRAEILVALGDLYQLWGKGDAADDRYKDAWNALAGADLADERARYFDQPVRLFGPTLSPVYPLPSKGEKAPPLRTLEPGYLVIRYGVDATGRVTDASVVEADPAGLMEQSAAEDLRRSLFRPRYADGVAVAAPAVTLRHEFRYSPTALARTRSAPDEGGGPLSPPDKQDQGPAQKSGDGALPPPASTD